DAVILQRWRARPIDGRPGEPLMGWLKGRGDDPIHGEGHDQEPDPQHGEAKHGVERVPGLTRHGRSPAARYIRSSAVFSRLSIHMARSTSTTIIAITM